MGTWEWQISSNKMFWSPTMEKIHGLLSGSFAGTFEAFAEGISAPDKDQVLRHVTEALQNKSNLKLEYRLTDGRWVEGRGSVILDGMGNPTQIVGICMDITQRKQFENDLRETE